MQAATLTANPSPYSKACDTFRPRIGQGAAIRAGLGGQSLVHFLKPSAMLNSLVRQLTTEGRPTRIKNRLGHVGFGKPGSRHITHRNQIELKHDAGAEFVQEIIAPVGGLGVYCTSPSHLVSALDNGQGLFSIPVLARCGNRLSIGQRGEVFEAEVNTNATSDRTLYAVEHFDADVQKPVAPSVLGEVGTVLDRRAGWHGSTFEDFEFAPVEVKATWRFFEVTALEWHPAQMLLTAIAQVRALLLRSGFGVLLAHRVDGAGVNAKLLAGSGGELVQVKTTEPLSTKAQGIFLSVVAVVKDKVHRTSLLVKQSIERFHPVPIDQNHTVYFNSIATQIQLTQRFALALYFPAMNDRVSRMV